MSVESRKILFIGGCPRSGTTLLASLLGSPESNLTIPELDIKFRLLEGVTDKRKLFNRTQILKLIRQQLKLWGIRKSLNSLDSIFPELTEVRTILDWIILYYQKEKHPSGEFHTWIDHDPENIKVVQSMMELYPEAKFVFISRDGRAVANSVLKLSWGPNSILKSAQWWLTYLGFGFTAMHAYQGKQLFMLRYEDLVSHTEKTLKAVCSLCKLDYAESMLQNIGFDVPLQMKKSHSQIGFLANPIRATAWKNELTSRQIELFEWVTKDVLQYLGYELMYDNNVRPPSVFEKTTAISGEWIWGLKHRIKRSLNNIFDVKI